MNRPVLERFENADAAAEAVAALIAERLAPPGKKSLVVTGGSGPGPVYDRLSTVDVGWEQVAEHSEIVMAFGGMALKNSMVAGGGVSRHVERGAMEATGRWIE